MLVIDNFLTKEEIRNLLDDLKIESRWKGLIDTIYIGKEYDIFNSRYRDIEYENKNLDKIIRKFDQNPDIIFIHNFKHTDEYNEFRYTDKVPLNKFSTIIIPLEGKLKVNDIELIPMQILLIKEKEKRKEKINYKGESKFIKLIYTK